MGPPGGPMGPRGKVKVLRYPGVPQGIPRGTTVHGIFDRTLGIPKESLHILYKLMKILIINIKNHVKWVWGHIKNPPKCLGFIY